MSEAILVPSPQGRRECSRLTVEAHDGHLGFGLESGDVAFPERELVQYVDDEGLGTLRGRVDALLRGGERDNFTDEARHLGHLLYRTLCPADLAGWMSESGPLVLHDDGRAMPWELVHDGREFWGLQHALGRWQGRGRWPGVRESSS